MYDTNYHNKNLARTARDHDSYWRGKYDERQQELVSQRERIDLLASQVDHWHEAYIRASARIGQLAASHANEGRTIRQLVDRLARTVSELESEIEKLKKER